MSAGWVPGGCLDDGLALALPGPGLRRMVPLLFLPGNSGLSLDACFGADAGREHYPQPRAPSRCMKAAAIHQQCHAGAPCRPTTACASACSSSSRVINTIFALL